MTTTTSSVPEMASQKAPPRPPPPPGRLGPDTTTDTTNTPETFQLQLSSGNGPVYRTVLRAPPRDATPDEIPIIDISGIFSPRAADRRRVAAEVRAASANNGFFYIRGHGVPEATTDAAHAACLAFFRQPRALKDDAAGAGGRSAYFNGYRPPRSQRINPAESVDNRETFSWTYDPRADPAVPSLASVPPRVRQFLRIEPGDDDDDDDDDDGDGDGGDECLMRRFPWSRTRLVPQFAPAVLAYWRACLALARALVRSFALSLDLDEHFFDPKVTHPDAALALNYYPPLLLPPTPPQSPAGGRHPQASSSSSSSSSPSSSPSPSPPPPPGRHQQQQQEQVSIGSHTDFQLFTILYQDSVPGLQVLSRSGQWLNAPPVRGTFVVNIADYLQRITNDLYVSTVHRAINTAARERVSMPFFFGFNLDQSCAVLDSCVAPGAAPRYAEVSCYDWVQRRVRAMHDTGARDGPGGGGGGDDDEGEGALRGGDR